MDRCYLLSRVSMNVLVIRGLWSYKYPRSQDALSFASISSFMKTPTGSSIFPWHEEKVEAMRAIVMKTTSAPISDRRRLTAHSAKEVHYVGGSTYCTESKTTNEVTLGPSERYRRCTALRFNMCCRFIPENNHST